MSKIIRVSCLVLMDRSKAIFAARRPEGKSLGGLWEFPGGKVETGEDPETALRREIDEELNLKIGDLTPLTPVTHAYDFATIELIPYLSHCKVHPTIQLIEHEESCWIPLETADSLPWAPADVPIVEEVKGLFAFQSTDHEP